MKTDIVILSSDAEVVKIENTSFILKLSLISSHEEAGTKVVLHAKVLLEEINNTITIRSPSGNTDIVILVRSLI